MATVKFGRNKYPMQTFIVGLDFNDNFLLVVNFSFLITTALWIFGVLGFFDAVSGVANLRYK